MIEFLEELKKQNRVSILTHMNVTELTNILLLPDAICIKFFALLSSDGPIIDMKRYSLNLIPVTITTHVSQLDHTKDIYTTKSRCSTPVRQHATLHTILAPLYYSPGSS